MRQFNPKKFIEGAILPLYKPRGPSSNQELTKLRRLIGIKKIGHAGTLDPEASGILVIGIGRSATKKLWLGEYSEKIYTATICLGATSSTDDSEGNIVEQINAAKPTRAQINLALKKFIGQIQQVPPQFSAINVAGKRAYAEARRGKTVELKARPVFIKNIKLKSYRWPRLVLQVSCGSGVYIRSLARDLGASLQIGGYLLDLVRNQVGKFTLKDAYIIINRNH